MRAAVFKGDGIVALEDVPEPRVEADDDVVIDVEACGICGTDLQILNVPPGHPARFSSSTRPDRAAGAARRSLSACAIAARVRGIRP